jgi:hypothetical protein
MAVTSDTTEVVTPPAASIWRNNAGILDQMVALGEAGCDVVCASRFMPGGGMVGCPLVKALLVRTANFTLYHFARVPTRDASIGFRLFSRRVIDDFVIGAWNQ